MVCSLASLSPHLIEDKAVTSAFNLGSYPMSKVRGRRWEDPHARGEAAKRSYPTSEVRGSGQKCQAAMVQEWPRGATRRPMPGAAAGRTYPTPQGRACGREERGCSSHPSHGCPAVPEQGTGKGPWGSVWDPLLEEDVARLLVTEAL